MTRKVSPVLAAFAVVDRVLQGAQGTICPLWPETAEAIRSPAEQCSSPAAEGCPVFRNHRGRADDPLWRPISYFGGTPNGHKQQRRHSAPNESILTPIDTARRSISYVLASIS